MTALTDITERAAAALDRFANGPDVSDRATALTDLLSQKALSRAVGAEPFRVGFDGLVQCLGPGGDPETRLAALVQLVRIAQSAKSVAGEIRKRTAPALESTLPTVSLLKDADDRGYVAKACGWASGHWVIDYAVQAIAEEETAEKVRAEFTRVLLARAGSLADAFSRLSKALATLRPKTESPADSVAKRLTRILAGLREAVVTSLIPPGEDAGESLGELVSKPFSALGLPGNRDACTMLAREVVLCTHDIVRTRFSVATDGGTYSAIKFAKRLFAGSTWPAELRGELDLVAHSILEAVLLLAKQGITACSLTDHLGLIVTHRHRADTLLRELADKHAELPEAVRAWLRKVPIPQKSRDQTALVESQELRLDPSVGQALLDSQHLEEAKEHLSTTVIPTLELYDPALVASVATLITRIETLVRAVEEMGKQRCLGLYGTPGMEMDFAPKYFESIWGIAGQRVLVIRPAIVRLADDGMPGDVIVKGLIE